EGPPGAPPVARPAPSSGVPEAHFLEKSLRVTLRVQPRAYCLEIRAAATCVRLGSHPALSWHLSSGLGRLPADGSPPIRYPAVRPRSSWGIACNSIITGARSSRCSAARLSRGRSWRAQQAERVRRIGMLAGQVQADPDMHARLDAFRHGLQGLGWVEGRNLHIDYRFADGRAERFTPLAKELLGLKPELIFAQSTASATAVQRESRTLPIVFVNVSDPIGAGFVASL